jgi:UDP-N-acetylmuramoyl-L-alanyl-D-glutamate--2,6-diaminopimelate ligase
LPTVGITGTNGKTTTLSLVSEALRRLSSSVATLGTLGFTLDGETLSETLTTPQPDTLAQALLTARQAGANYCVMEVSSHALSQRRVAGVQFEVVAFSNLSQDHLDFHGSMEDYAEAKASLFSLGPRHRVINVTDRFGKVLAARYPDALLVDRTGQATADLRLDDLSISREGISATVDFRGRRHPLRSPLVGDHNADNLLLSLGILVSLGVKFEEATDALGQVTMAAGRLERCDGPEDDILCVVDYAHTPDALKNVLEAGRRLQPRQLVCVFGCGGDRDRGKRSLMGEAAATLADVVWVTTDNPRSEDPRRILDEIRPGLAKGRASTHEELERKTAIERAVLSAQPGSVVMICGKGHETYQLVGDQVLDFDDRICARAALGRRRALRGDDGK